MKKKFIFAAMAAVTVLATGCSQDENINEVINKETGAIEFRGVVDKTTRATAVGNTTELTNFFVQAGAHANAVAIANLDFMSTPVYKQAGAWTYAPAKYFPSNGDEVNFYAYAPIKDVNMTTDMDIVGTTAQFGYTVPADQKVDNTAVDLLVAEALDKVATSPATAVTLAFNHALSAVSFSAANRNATTGYGSELTYVISDIKITKMDNVGTFDYPLSATSWTPTAARDQNYVAGLPEAGVSLQAIGTGDAQKLLSANDLMMVLPQGVTVGTLDTDGVTPFVDETFVEVTYSLKDGEGAPVFSNAKRLLTLPAGFEFKAGTRYNFEFEFGANDQANAITFDVTVNAWTDAPNQVLPQ